MLTAHTLAREDSNLDNQNQNLRTCQLVDEPNFAIFTKASGM